MQHTKSKQLYIINKHGTFSDYETYLLWCKATKVKPLPQTSAEDLEIKYRFKNRSN